MSLEYRVRIVEPGDLRDTSATLGARLYGYFVDDTHVTGKAAAAAVARRERVDLRGIGNVLPRIRLSTPLDR